MTIEFKGIEFDSAHEAIPHTYASGRGKAACIGGRNLVISEDDGRRLEATGVEFAFLCDHEMADGSHRIVTVPVN